VRAAPQEPPADTVNRAVLQTLPRTVNTGTGAAFILTALAVLGGPSLADFALALAVGTYSSVLTAAPVALELGRRTRTGLARPRRS
jgi:SecD/SecF fusion protein